MKNNKKNLMIIFLVYLTTILGCDLKSTTLENNYTLPKATKENVDKVVQKALNSLVFVKGGSFLMGDGGYLYNGDRVYWSPFIDNFPVHKVVLESYSISKYEITYWEYDVYSDLQKTEIVGLSFQHQYFRQGNYPAGDVSWHAARDYCQWLGEKTGLPFDLPTEAQWEYAARSRGQNVGFATDNGKMEDGRNHRKGGDRKYLFAVGTFPPNPLGLHEMSGNASEWVLDWYDEKYYEKSPVLNPKGPKAGFKKVLRGGTPTSSPTGNNVYIRSKYWAIFDKNNKEYKKYFDDHKRAFNSPPSNSRYYYGVRCVVNLPKAINQ